MKFKRIILKVLGLYQILGGMYGVYKFFATFIGETILHWIQGILLIVPLIIIPLIAGFYLLFTEQIKRGLKWTFVNQLLQFIQFKVLGIGLFYISGMFYNFGIVKDSLGWHFCSDGRIFDYECIVKIYSYDHNILFLINIIPFLIITILTFGKFYETNYNE